MLNLNPGLMSSMDDSHLIAALGCEASLMRTPVEAELLRRLEEGIDLETGAEVEARLEKSYESAMEQSEFRAQCIGEILELCDKAMSKVDLIAAIKSTVENSYVEL